MRGLVVLCSGALIMFLLSACSVNTIFDDGDYRPIGEQAPRNPKMKLPIPGDASPLPSSADFDASSVLSLESQPSGTAVLDSANNIGKSAAPSQRYGNPRLVNLIAGTAELHCVPKHVRLSDKAEAFWTNSDRKLTQCIYTFPNVCGANTFAVLTYGDKKVLAYWDSQSQRYILDTLKGNFHSTPGLWDKDDHVGTDANNFGYFLDDNFEHPAAAQKSFFNIGWVIKASFADEQALGKLYQKAIEKSAECF